MAAEGLQQLEQPADQSTVMDIDYEAEDSDGWIAVGRETSGDTIAQAPSLEPNMTDAKQAAVDNLRKEREHAPDEHSKGTSRCDDTLANISTVDLTEQHSQASSSCVSATQPEKQDPKPVSERQTAILKVCRGEEIFRIHLQLPTSINTIRKAALNAVDLDESTTFLYNHGQEKRALPCSGEEPIAEELQTLLESSVIRIYVQKDAGVVTTVPDGGTSAHSTSQPSRIRSSNTGAARESPSAPSSVLAGPWWWLGGQFGNLLAGSNQDAALRAALAESAQLSRAVEASKAEARARLDKVLSLYGVKLKKIEGDGNCQYRALAVQLLGDQMQHGSVRARTVKQLRAHPDRYSAYVHEPWEDYLVRMAKDGQWGDNVSLQAACDTFGVEIRVFTDLPGAECVEITPAEPVEGAPQKPLLMAFTSEVHYDVAEPMSMAPGAIAQISENLTRLLKRRRFFE